MNLDEKLPAIRPLDVTPFRAEDDEMRFALRDQTQIATQVLAISPAGYFVLAQLDGRRSCNDIRAAFLEQFGRSISAEQIESMLAELDAALLLDTDRYRNAYRQRRDEYLASSVRDNRARWPDEASLRDELRQLIESEQFEHDGAIVGAIAPHLDYARGAPCYAATYRRLACADAAERYVILGTNHFGRSSSVVATRKDFLTPLGRVETDVSFIERVERRLGAGICENEFDHQAEHSIELQVHLLQACHPDASFDIVPVLCPDPSGPTGTAPRDGRGPDLDDFCDALRDALDDSDRNTIVIAGADLSHVGQQFGDAQPATDEVLDTVGEKDRALLDKIVAHDERGFVDAVRAVENATHICSVGCIYTLLRALPDASCTLLHYHQAVDHDADVHVTCAASILR